MRLVDCMSDLDCGSFSVKPVTSCCLAKSLIWLIVCLFFSSRVWANCCINVSLGSINVGAERRSRRLREKIRRLQCVWRRRITAKWVWVYFGQIDLFFGYWNSLSSFMRGYVFYCPVQTNSVAQDELFTISVNFLILDCVTLHQNTAEGLQCILAQCTGRVF